ncbi:A coat protein [Stenotrophomonas maltophilia]|uniref:A coat protein n=3 Tax=Gammaproteobacteria TaxID=1236 RepID=UPI0012B09D09|nr:A coat protein [Stenotrophomonas maltophilia]MBH1631840.1 A coat protein [Stenotrophomonas maltophilia]MCU1145208.1 A coat protein [Stenotrophomonas maltophilia]QGL92978.1 A coat protein [Stenotrophomonas maltophilia]HEL4147695.1 A coat protein [Stenotrophomonas maltophilia]
MNHPVFRIARGAVIAAISLLCMLLSAPAFAIDQGEAMGACISFSKGYWPTVGGKFIRCENSSTPKQIWSVGEDQWGRQIVYGGWEWQDSCSTRNTSMPPGDKAAASPMPWPNCVSGCKVQQEHIAYNQPGGVKLYGRRDATYLNEVCMPDGTSQNGIIDPRETKQEQPKPTEPECVALGGGQTACAKPNGDHCATSSTGKTFCWKPNETGEKKDGTDAQTKGEKGKPVTPPTHTDPTKEYQRKEGHQQTACINNTCTTYNVTNYGETGKGQAKNSTGDNNPDGTGNTSGNGTPGKGSGSGSGGNEGGEGDSASDSGNCEQPPLCTGDTLKCLHLRFTWKIQCNTKGSEITKGEGCGDNDVPVCAGSSCKAEAYAQLLQQWRARCSAEKLAKGIEDQAGQGDGDDGKGSIFIDDSGKNPSLDEGKVSYAGGQLGYSFEVEGVKFEMPQQLLDFLPILRMLIIALATLAAIGIMRGNG